MRTRIDSLRFLVVEDHCFQRWAVGNSLTGLGATDVLSAADGFEALDLFRAADPPIDIIVSDLDMPWLDGMEFIRHVGETGTPVSLIVTSALEPALLASAATMAKIYGIDMLDVIEKPATPRKLKAAISRYRPAAGAPGQPHASPHLFSPEELAAASKKSEFQSLFPPKVGPMTGKRVREGLRTHVRNT